MTLSYDTAFQPGPLALKMKLAAGTGKLVLPVCRDCHRVQYPPREICFHCLGDDVAWQEIDSRGTVLASTAAYVSLESHFNQTAPYHVGLVRLDAGATVVARLPKKMTPGTVVTVQAAIDEYGTGILTGQE